MDSDGHKRLNRNAVVNAAQTPVNNDGVGSDEENPQFFMLGCPKKVKPNSDDEGLGDALDVLLNDGGIPLVNKGDASPLPSWRGDDEDPSNEVDYEGSEEADLFLDSESDQATIGNGNLQPLGNANSQSKDVQVINQPLGSGEKTTQAIQPVLTQQGVMDLVAKDVGGLLPGEGWEQRKQVYYDMLERYKSPTGSSVRVAIDVAALIIISAVSESTSRNSLKLQHEANEKLLKQAEEHRALAQKQFTDSMTRMQTEHEKTIEEATRIRDEYAKSAAMAQVSYDSMMNKVESNQSTNVVKLQMAFLLKKTQKYERDLKEISEKHEEEMQDKEDLCRKYKRDLDRERNKNKALEQECENLEPYPV